MQMVKVRDHFLHLRIENEEHLKAVNAFLNSSKVKELIHFDPIEHYSMRSLGSFFDQYSHNTAAQKFTSNKRATIYIESINGREPIEISQYQANDDSTCCKFFQHISNELSKQGYASLAKKIRPTP